MSVRRVMGAEVEYGISVSGQPRANPVNSSSLLVNAYARTLDQQRRARWDYDQEYPLRDARGHEVAREAADPSQLTDEDAGLANVILTNGARLYVDHAHPEFSTPEVTTPLDVVTWDCAGEEVMRRAAAAVSHAGGPELLLHKNNTDNKGVSYGAHENYLMERSTPFSRIAKDLIPFFVTRQVICGAGRVGIGRHGREPGFQISQRADFFEVEVGLETTVRRPIINTRDEPHADPARHRRLHVIIGDANVSQLSTYLKFGTTSVLLSLVEAGALPDDLSLAEPVFELQQVSRDPSLRHRVTLKDGRRLTAVELQRLYWELCSAWLERGGGERDEATAEVMTRWDAVLARLEQDPVLCVGELDWVAKWQLVEKFKERDCLEWNDAKLQLIDLQYADLRPERSLHQKLVRSGRMTTLVPPSRVLDAVLTPPQDTRAYFRGRCLAQFPEFVHSASWDSVILDLPGRAALTRVPTPDPERGTQEHVGALFEAHADVEEFFAALTSPDR